MRDKQKHIAGEGVLCTPDAYIRFLYLRINPYQPIWEVFILNFPKVAPPPKQTNKQKNLHVCLQTVLVRKIPCHISWM